MRIGRIALALSLMALAAVVWRSVPSAFKSDITAVTQSTEDRSVFFRLVSKYRHGEELIEFDVVVGCAVKVTSYMEGGSSYDAFRDPIFFVKATADGSAIMQLVPDACQGQTTERGEVPEDFLPGAIWFEDANDLSLGIAYVAEDAFENQNSELKFLGAAIFKATREDWEAFRPIASRNLMDQRPFIFGRDEVPAAQIAQGWDRELLKKWLPVVSCKGYARYRVTDPAFKKLLEEYWPQHRPDYWAPDSASNQRFVDALAKWPMVDGISLKQRMRNYDQAGFATRAQGGQFYSGTPGSDYPSQFYPLRAEDGVPWIDPSIVAATTIRRDVDLRDGANAGFLYCYAWLRYTQSELRDRLVPHYLDREFILRVDGVPVDTQQGPDSESASPPVFFFGKDEYLFRQFSFGLS